MFTYFFFTYSRIDASLTLYQQTIIFFNFLIAENKLHLWRHNPVTEPHLLPHGLQVEYSQCWDPFIPLCVNGSFMLLLASTPANPHWWKSYKWQFLLKYNNTFISLISYTPSFEGWPHTELLGHPHICKCFFSQLGLPSISNKTVMAHMTKMSLFQNNKLS